jgi:hypothetical protein
MGLPKTGVTENLQRNTAARHLGAFINPFQFPSSRQAVCESLRACLNGKILNLNHVPTMYWSPGNVPTRSHLSATNPSIQYEIAIAVLVLNQMLDLGCPDSVRIA